MKLLSQRRSVLQIARGLARGTASLIGDRAGATAVVTGLASTALLGFAGLGTEVGQWYMTHRSMVAAADQAALTAATALDARAPSSAIVTEAKAIAAQNGFTDGISNVIVSVNHPPASGSHQGNANAVEVVIRQQQNAIFSALFLATPPTISARSVGQLVGGKNCIFAMNPSAPGSLHIEGGDTINSNCGVVVNSQSSTAATIDGSLTAPTVNLVGGFSGTVNSPSIHTGVPPQLDPLLYVEAPIFGGCDRTGYAVSSGTATLNPGVYCGGINISGSAHVKLNAGTYVLSGGGLNVRDNANLTGTGVTFYNTGTNFRPYAPITSSGNVMIDLTAPTSGALEGILFFQDRSIVSTATNVLAGKLTGALYFPTTALLLNQQQDVAVPYTIIVADTINLSVNTLTINNDYSSLIDGSPAKSINLVE
jgi:Flp pilus assembly protein TadG